MQLNAPIPLGQPVAPLPREDPNAKNWLIHQLYVSQDFQQALTLCQEVIDQFDGRVEYPLYIKALIKRRQGRIQESLELFQQVTRLNPHSIDNLKQVGRSLFLLGKHKAAVDVYEEALTLGIQDWELWHNKGMCFMYLKDFAKAEECFAHARKAERHDVTHMQLGRLYTLQENYAAAIEIYKEALDYSPDNPELMTTIGILYSRLGDNEKAIEFLGNSLTHDPKNPKTILAAGSIIQDHGDMDTALVKYRIAALATPNSAQLWNNVGMCFFAKGKPVPAISCLKRALDLAPFEWIVAYNLGLVHLTTRQYASAFHYLSSSINLKNDYASAYMYLAVTLAKLDDFENSCDAYRRAIEMESDFLFHLNFAITLFNNNAPEARLQCQEARRLFDELDEESRSADPDVQQHFSVLEAALGITPTAPTQQETKAQ
ncbi:putative Bardet-Biedl syndrome 4 protein [Paratrimastix pyriformis]|uniref:Bardet-Biedl syndrome 4 protein n=1 Tax=Paratrimastix pyriformis TaxID=342808 RepID=A0ABQ8UJ84_9EUKA|nr:putative Bardet-Biedl syndrome 4 protein [Paratrimastix pyriformis]